MTNTIVPPQQAVKHETQAAESILPGVNVLLMGPAGVGKTYSLGTLVESGLEVFYVGLEPGLESLLAYFTDKGKPVPDNLHWHILKAPKASFKEMRATATRVNTQSYEILAKAVDPDRSKHTRMISLLEVMENFTDQRTGEIFGPVDAWTASRALVVDGMAGLGRAAMSLVIGGKVVANQADWQVAQSQVKNFVVQCTESCECHFILLAHVERETDAVMGGVKLLVSTLGKALAPQLPPMFSDVILAMREGNKFTWDTASAQADVKTRNLPIQSGLSADFRNIIAKWKSRGGVA